MENKWNVLLPQMIEDEAVEVLKESNFKITVSPECTFDAVKPLMKNANAISLRTGIKITKELLEDCEELYTISRTGGGVDNVDLAACTEKGVLVTSSLGVNMTSVAEHGLAFILALSKQFSLLDSEVRKNNFKIRYKNLPSDIRGKTLGVVGFGRIGAELARMCKSAFDMRIVAHDDYLPRNIKEKYSEWVDFRTLDFILSESDFVSVHIPLTAETKNLIDYEKLKLMKKSSFIINTSRGGTINEKDLIKALENGIIRGAGLDVFESEPPEKDNRLLSLWNVILTPHTAALTSECVIRMATSSAERIKTVYSKKLPDNIANPEVLKSDRWLKYFLH